MNSTNLKYTLGFLALVSLFALVLLGKWDAASYAELVIGLITGAGAHAVATYKPAVSPAPVAPASQGETANVP